MALTRQNDFQLPQPDSTQASNPESGLVEDLEEDSDEDLTIDQREVVHIMKKTFHEQYGSDADAKDIFRKNNRRWDCFCLVYSSIAFHLVEIVDIFYEVDKICIDHWELDMDGIRDPFQYLSFRVDVRLQDWTTQMNKILFASTLHLVYGDKWGDVKDIGARLADHDFLLELEDMISSMKEQAPLLQDLIPRIRARCSFIVSTFHTMESLEEQRRKQALQRQGLRNRKGFVSGDSLTAIENSPAIVHEAEREASFDIASVDIQRNPGTAAAWSTTVNTDGYVLPIGSKRSGRQYVEYPVQNRVLDAALRPEMPKAYNAGLIKSMSLPITFLGHKSTLLFVLPCLMVVSGALVGVSVTRTHPTTCHTSAFDDGFYTSLSQMILSLCSLYCIVVPLLRSRRIPGFRYFWFVFGLTLSAVTGITSVIVYPFQVQASTVLGFVSGAVQVISTVQLIEGVDAIVGGTDLA